MLMNTQESPRNRTVEESLTIAHKLMCELEGTLERLHTAVTGGGNVGADSANEPYGGIASSADHLTARLQGFLTDLNRTTAIISSPQVKGLGDSPYNSQNNALDPNYAKHLG